MMATQKPRNPAAPLKTFRNLITFRLHLLAGRSERHSENYYRARFDLNLPECRVIGITGGYGHVTFKKVCEDANLEKSYASRIINRLVERGYIEKVENPSDQRSVILTLTTEGRGLHHDLVEAAEALNRQLTEVLSPEQNRTMMACLLLLTERLSVIEASANSDPMLAAGPNPEPVATPLPAVGQSEVKIDSALARQLHQLLARALDDAR